MTSFQFPTDFIQRVTADPFLGSELLDALNESAPISVRYNPMKSKPSLPVSGEVTWCSDAVYLKERPVYTLDPLFHAGCYYPQEAGSMVIDSVLQQLDLPNDPLVLDLCGAPGGKSTLLLSFLRNQGLLVANEVIQNRSRILKENCSKWGYSNIVVTNNDPSDFKRLPSFFDLALVDAPCSGEGMFRKDPDARKEWSADNVRLCASRQRRILGDVWNSIKPGGIVLYSTCTFNAAENEENVKWVQDELGARLITVELPIEFKEGRNGVGSYAMPGKLDAEGFYIAVLQKTEGVMSSQNKRKDKKNKSNELSQEKDMSVFQEKVRLEGMKFWRWRDLILSMPENVEKEMLQVYNALRIVKLGTEIGTMARKGFVPSHDLSMNVALRRVEDCIVLNKEQALMYLKGETFDIQGNRGMQMVSFAEEPLGWIKHLGNRFNNAYPKEWRIKMKLK
jgi:16S rRNA C967 or C1407 C5-methylase (RsmB/RsmF family)/NOL1/NOP2/fmu family ribosome biogenesis protein